MAAVDVRLEDFCRLCAIETKDGIVIYSNEGATLCLEEKIVQCLRIDVSENDQLPKKVCEPCHSRLEDCHLFAEQANKVQHTLELLVQMRHLNVHIEQSSESKSFENSLVAKEEDRKVADFPLDITLHSSKGLEKTLIEKEESMKFADFPLDASLHSDIEDEDKCCNNINFTEDAHHQVEKGDTSSGFYSESPEDNFEQLHLQGPEGSENDQIGLSDCIWNKETNENLEENAKNVYFKRLSSDEELDEEDADVDFGEEEEDEGDEESTQFSVSETTTDGITDDKEVMLEEMDKNSKDEWKAHWGIKCNICSNVFPFKSTFDKHYRTAYNKKPEYTCSYCNKVMLKYSTFRSHCYRHVTEGRYRCEYCQKGFSLRSMLRIHVLAKHTAIKPFICEECGKGFVTKPGLTIHLKKHRNDLKHESYPCDVCGKILHTRGGLTAHRNVHKLGRRFMCDVCGKTFTQKVNMLQHVKHHTGERPYTCEKCGKCFAEKSHLNRHYSFHSEKRPFQCKVCMKMYKTERCLKVHAMVHSEARPHICTYCSKGFLSTTKLKQHYNIHTGERPYSCKFCERSFTNYPNWLKHTRRRHKVEPRNLKLIESCESNDITLISHENLKKQELDLEQQESILARELMRNNHLTSNIPQSSMSMNTTIPNSQTELCMNNSSGMSLNVPYLSQNAYVSAMSGEVLMQQTSLHIQYPEHLMNVHVPHLMLFE